MFDIISQINRIETAERALAATLARIDNTMQGRQPYTPEAETEERAAAWSAYTSAVDEVTELFYAEIDGAQQIVDLAEARAANPRMEWSAQELAEYATHLSAIERDLRSYSTAALEPQVLAALSTTNARLIAAWRDALNGHFADLQRDSEATPAQRATVADWVAKFDQRVRERPAAIQELTAAQKRLDAIRDGRKRASEITRDRAVERNRVALAATGTYGRL